MKIATATASAVFAVALCAGISPQAPQAEAQSSPDVAKALTSSQGTDTRAPEGGAKVVVLVIPIQQVPMHLCGPMIAAASAATLPGPCSCNVSWGWHPVI
ncbi:hypothetical protein [Corynebacterium durum]|uniref:hypothetical protein n=1 Tax=Corynebacterium durum TaxID=61592 RepID=UPI00034B0442|nr:hypothetical protein [Corynebacterium durum]